MGNGMLYGVSVGPGDPELLTLKALRIIRQSPVIAVPRTRGGNTLALDIAAQAVELEGKKILYLDQLMGTDQEAMQQRYAENAARVMDELADGADVALLNLGDVTIYSTCAYIMELVAQKGFRCEMLPGVTSFCACAALLGQSLAEWDQPLHIFPGSYQDLDAALDTPGGKVLMKSARALPVIREKIIQRGLQDRTSVVSDCGLPTQKIYSITDEDIHSYFTMIIIRP